jgi:glycosyltransferase involved in cell wall biosynthesis
MSIKYPLVSVVIPAYNEEEYLPKVLKALENQTYPNYEVVVVNNASEDKTAEVARRFSARVVNEPKRGLIYAREKGFESAKGDIIVRTDADSIPGRKWIEIISKPLIDDPDVVAVTGSAEYMGEGELYRYISRVLFWIYFYFIRLVMGHYQLSGPNFAVRRRVVLKTKPHLDENVVQEDVDLSCHMREYGKLVFIPSLVMSISFRRFHYDRLFMLKYLMGLIRTYFLHHPSHKLHKVK